MTQEDVRAMLNMLDANFPSTFKNLTQEQSVLLEQMWFDAFKDEDSELVKVAFFNYIKNNEYPPNIGGLNKELKKLKPSTSNPNQIWGEINRAVRNSLYNSQEEFEQLSEVAKAYITNPAQLKEMANMDMATLETVGRGLFMKQAPALIEKHEAKKTMNMIGAKNNEALQDKRVLPDMVDDSSRYVGTRNHNGGFDELVGVGTFVEMNEDQRMKRTKKKPSDKQMAKMKDAIAQEVGQKMFLVMTGVLVDYDSWDEDRICAFYEHLAHTTDLMDNYYLKAKDIQKIIEKKTGCRLGVKW